MVTAQGLRRVSDEELLAEVKARGLKVPVLEEVPTSLGELVQEMGRVKQLKDEVTAAENALWTELFRIADDVAGVDQEYRYVDRTTFLAIGRSITEALSKRLRERDFLEDPHLTPELRRKVVKRVEGVDFTKLEKALDKHTIPAALVKKHLKPPQASKLFHPCTKEERAAIEEELYVEGGR